MYEFDLINYKKDIMLDFSYFFKIDIINNKFYIYTISDL